MISIIKNATLKVTIQPTRTIQGTQFLFPAENRVISPEFTECHQYI